MSQWLTFRGTGLLPESRKNSDHPRTTDITRGITADNGRVSCRTVIEGTVSCNRFSALAEGSAFQPARR